MITGLPFIPGNNQQEPSPLSRFLPSIQEGVVTSWLRSNQALIQKSSQQKNEPAWILDPFGADPKLPLEIAQNGYRVLVAANNPILRLLIELSAQPTSESELRSALSELASSQKSGERLELHIQSLYQTECEQCGSRIQVEAFLWDRGSPHPSAKTYLCTFCGDSGERPISQKDLDLLREIGPPGLHRARALERVASIDDPDRKHAEEALDSYLPRSIYVLFTLVNKLESLAEHKRCLSALLLTTFDQANSLWPYPNVRARPRLLTIPTHFRENNIWTALEASIHLWKAKPDHRPVPFAVWPDTPPLTGGICIYEGRIRDLVQRQLTTEGEQSFVPELNIGAVITALPRPNQAFWTLSALWTGWLFGREATTPIKNVLRRRRYDWSWHCTALHAAFESFASILDYQMPVVTLIGEAESGFLSSALLAGSLAGLDLKSISMRSEIGQAQIIWEAASKKPYTRLSQNEILANLSNLTQECGLEYLRIRNEPAIYMQLISSVLADAITSHLFNAETKLTPGDFQADTMSIMQKVFAFGGKFQRFNASEHSLDVGQWWINEEPVPPANSGNLQVHSSSLPLSDRVEIALVNYLLENPGKTFEQIDARMCEIFPGLLTPEISLVETCLKSYAEEMPYGSNSWHLRTEDQPKNRRSDLKEMQELILQIGENLGFQCHIEIDQKSPLVIWSDPEANHPLYYLIQASALIYRFLLTEKYPAESSFLVIPGGRAGLLDYKIQHDPRLMKKIEAGFRFVKFRNIRRNFHNATLSRHSFESLLSGDSITKSETQIQLL